MCVFGLKFKGLRAFTPYIGTLRASLPPLQAMTSAAEGPTSSSDEPKSEDQADAGSVKPEASLALHVAPSSESGNI